MFDLIPLELLITLDILERQVAEASGGSVAGGRDRPCDIRPPAVSTWALDGGNGYQIRWSSGGKATCGKGVRYNARPPWNRQWDGSEESIAAGVGGSLRRPP